MSRTSGIKRAVYDYWDHRAASYDASPGHDVKSADVLSRWRELLARSAGSGPLEAVDVGCGTGFIALLLAELGHRVTGVDQSARMLELARAKAQGRTVDVEFRQGDADDLPLPDGSVDLVAERHVLWTMPDPLTTLTEWSRVLRPGGRIVLVEGDWRDGMTDAQLADSEPDFVRDYAEVKDKLPLYGGRPVAQIAELVQVAGFVDVHSEPLVEDELWEDVPGTDRGPDRRYLVHASTPRAAS